MAVDYHILIAATVPLPPYNHCSLIITLIIITRSFNYMIRGVGKRAAAGTLKLRFRTNRIITLNPLYYYTSMMALLGHPELLVGL